jgi:VWFA-related protein
MSQRPRALACALLAIFALCRPLPAQEPLQEPVREEIVEVESIDEIESQDLPIATAPERSYILLFDYPSYGSLDEMEKLRAAVETWVGQLRPEDAVAVASYYGNELLLQQDFTRDRKALAGAIDGAIQGRSHEGTPPEDSTYSLLAHLPRREELSPRTRNFYGLLQVFADLSGSMPGSKNLVIFSKGFGRARPAEVVGGPEMGLAGAASAITGSPILEKYQTDRNLYEMTAEALRMSGIHLFPVDMATDYRDTYPLAGVMSRLAADTGGRYFYPVDDALEVFERIAEIAPGNTRHDNRREAVAGGGGRKGSSDSRE